MVKAEIKGKAEVNTFFDEVDIEFGRTQGGLYFSSNGTVQRKLKLKDGDKVKVTIEKVS